MQEQKFIAFCPSNTSLWPKLWFSILWTGSYLLVNKGLIFVSNIANWKGVLTRNYFEQGRDSKISTQLMQSFNIQSDHGGGERFILLLLIARTCTLLKVSEAILSLPNIICEHRVEIACFGRRIISLNNARLGNHITGSGNIKKCCPFLLA